jgi:hypothetical protein
MVVGSLSDARARRNAQSDAVATRETPNDPWRRGSRVRDDSTRTPDDAGGDPVRRED